MIFLTIEIFININKFFKNKFYICQYNFNSCLVLLLSYINIGLTNVVGLILTPYIVNKLGNSEYGLYLLIGSIIIYLSVMDLGLNNSVIRYVSLYRAENKLESEKKLISSIFLIYLVICLLVLILGILVYNYFDKIFCWAVYDLVDHYNGLVESNRILKIDWAETCM